MMLINLKLLTPVSFFFGKCFGQQAYTSVKKNFHQSDQDPSQMELTFVPLSSFLAQRKSSSSSQGQSKHTKRNSGFNFFEENTSKLHLSHDDIQGKNEERFNEESVQSTTY